MLGTLYTEVGIGYAGGNHYWGVYTMHFGNGNTASCASTPDPEQPQNFDTTTTANLRIRQNPSTQGTILGTLPYGSGVIFLDGEAIADGYTWYYVASRGYEGWVAGAYLAGYNAPPPPTTTPPPSTDEGVSFTTSTRLNLRVGAGTSYGVIQTMPAGTTVTDYDGELRYANGYTWRSVQTPYGIGWVATAYLY